MRRRYWSVIVAVVALLAAADSIYWWIASDRLRAGVQAWVRAQRAAGWTVNDMPVTIGGWPFTAEARIPSVDIRHTGEASPGEARYHGDGLLLAVPLFHPTRVLVTFAGPQVIAIGAGPAITIAGAIALTVPLRAAGLSFGLVGRDLRVDPEGSAWHAGIGSLDLDTQVPDSADAQAAAMTFSLSARAIALPPIHKWALGDDIAALSLSGGLNGPIPAGKGVTGESVTAWADAWRDGGGSLEIRHLALTWGPLDLISSATLALDDQLQPMGSGSAKLVGYAETLDRLAGAGVLTKSAATVAKAVLSLLAGTGEAGTPSSVDVPLSLQYRTLSMRQVPLARLPELDWPPR